MTRPLAAIIAAILLSQPKMAPSTVRGYAEVIRKESVDHHVDPFTVVAIVHFESRWIASTEAKDCVGLGQVCLSNYRVCREDPRGDRCARRRIALLDGKTNLRTIFEAITANRRFCREKTGRARYHHWLASFGGFNNPSRGIWCGQHRVKGRWRDLPVHWITQRVMDRRAMLGRYR